MSFCKIVQSDNLKFLSDYDSWSVDLIVIDVPFNTGKRQERKRTDGTVDHGYDDYFEDYIGFMRQRIREAKRVLKDNGSLFFWADYREIHYAKVMLDQVFGRESFMNEIIWAYDYGGRSKSRWSAKHDNILWYAKNPKDYTFNYDAIDRIPYMAPNLQTPERAAIGKTPTDVWWHTIVPTNGKEKTGYATQKPLALLERIVKVHSNPGDIVMDFFAGSGTSGEAALKNGRSCVLCDINPEAIEVMNKRLSKYIDSTSKDKQQ